MNGAGPGLRRPSAVLMTADTVGGVWSYTLSLCRELAETRFIVATMGPPARPEQRREIGALGNVALVESGFRLEWMAGGIADLPASRGWLAALAERHDADLVHVNGYGHARLDCALPTLVVAHSDVLSWWRAVHRCAAPAEWGDYRGAVVDGLDAAARIVAPGAAVIDDLSRHYGLDPARADVIANGVDLAAFAPSPKRPVVMAAGRIWDPAKNLEILDRVAGALSWPVEIAGAVEHPEAGAARLVNARALGRLSGGEMASRLARAAIFAAPARYEPFGLAILEAAAAGCALVLGDIASLRENWDGAALFVEPDDADGLRRTLARLIANPSERSRLAASARRRAGRFTADSMARAYAALYLSTATHAAAPAAAPEPTGVALSGDPR